MDKAHLGYTRVHKSDGLIANGKGALYNRKSRHNIEMVGKSNMLCRNYIFNRNDYSLVLTPGQKYMLMMAKV